MIVRRILLSLFLFLLMVVQADAQRRTNTDKYFEEKGNLASRLWYGGGLNLGFAGGNDFSQFIFGLAPMVGYKITEEFSIGPRIGFDYQYVRGNAAVFNPDFNSGSFVGYTNEKKATTSFSGGVFTRYKAFQNFFAHLEFSVENRELFLQDRFGFLIYETGSDELLTLDDTRENFYVGIGYTSGYPLGFEMLLLYNFNEPENTIDLPFDFRFGFNYNF